MLSEPAASRHPGWDDISERVWVVLPHLTGEQRQEVFDTVFEQLRLALPKDEFAWFPCAQSAPFVSFARALRP